MKAPTAASLKKVNPENLSRLGAERLAQVLVEIAEARPDVKRRLRMELAAEQGPEHLTVEVDKRINSVETSRGKVTWRRRAAFIRDLDQLRRLIVERLTALDKEGAAERLWRFIDLAPGLGLRMRDKDGSMDAVFAQAAADLGQLIDASAALRLSDALAVNPSAWARWLPELLAQAPAEIARPTLVDLAGRRGATPSWLRIARTLADASGDVDAFIATFSPAAVATQPVAADVGRRLLAAGRLEEARRVLQAGRPRRPGDTEPDWESAWIELLEAGGEAKAAQAARWAAFERTLSVDIAREFTRRLPDFDDVEAETRAFAYAAQHSDADKGLAFLMSWPALPEAARMIAGRKDELSVDPELAEAWAAKLRGRQPAAALILLRKAAAAAFRRRELALCDRLTAEAEALDADSPT